MASSSAAAEIKAEGGEETGSGGTTGQTTSRPSVLGVILGAGSHPRGGPNDFFEPEQILVFSDAVVAIAITLLALDLRLPETPSGTEGEEDLGTRILALWPSFLSFLVSFYVISRYWIIHRRCFAWIIRTDHPFVLLELVFLMTICLVPFATSVLGQNSGVASAAVITYSIIVTMVGTSLTALWLYAALGRRLTPPNLTDRAIWILVARLMVPPVVSLISIPIAIYAGGRWALLSWLSMFVLLVALRLIAYFTEKRQPLTTQTEDEDVRASSGLASTYNSSTNRLGKEVYE